MLCATACAQAQRRPIWPRYPAVTPSCEPSWPAYSGPSASSIASVASWPARRLTPRPRSRRRRSTAGAAGARARTSGRSRGSARPRPGSCAACSDSMNGASVFTARAGHLRERRPLVAEDPGVAVLVGGDVRRPSTCARSSSGARARGTRDRTRRGRNGLRLRARDLERGHERGQLVADDDTTGRSFERKLKPV